jgi:hypothetical protein
MFGLFFTSYINIYLYLSFHSPPSYQSLTLITVRIYLNIS